jgi:acyl carrier protein
MPPLRGVIHAAGVLDDRLVAQQTIERFHRVMAPKARAAWILHQHTRQMDLDFFVLFSSAASLIGSSGQSNYAAANAYLDALARYRQSLGLPGLSINWGAWAGDGMAGEAVRERMAARGVSAIPPEEGLALLAQLLALAAGRPQIGVMPVDWPKFLQQFAGAVPPFLEAFAPQAAGAGPSFRERLAAAPEAMRPQLLREFLQDTLAVVLGLPSGSRIAPQQGFFDLGMDSLMALEFRNRLEAELGMHLSATLAFDYPSLDALGSHLAGTLLPAGRAAAEAAELEALSEDELARLLAEELTGDETDG